MIHTERLCINYLNLEDDKAFSKYRNKEEVYRYQTWTRYSIFRAKFRINQCLREEFHKNCHSYQLAIRLLDETLIGDFYLEPQSNDAIVIGYSMDNDYWNNGYATEGLQALLVWLRDVHHYQVVIAHVYTANSASIKLLERVGFEKFDECKRDKTVSYHYIY